MNYRPKIDKLKFYKISINILNHISVTVVFSMLLFPLELVVWNIADILNLQNLKKGQKQDHTCCLSISLGQAEFSENYSN